MMEVRYSYIKIDSLVKELNEFIDRTTKLNSEFLREATRIESQISRLKRNLNEDLKNDTGNNISFEKKQLELLNSIQENIKSLKKNIDEYGIF